MPYLVGLILHKISLSISHEHNSLHHLDLEIWLFGAKMTKIDIPNPKLIVRYVYQPFYNRVIYFFEVSLTLI